MYAQGLLEDDSWFCVRSSNGSRLVKDLLARTQTKHALLFAGQICQSFCCQGNHLHFDHQRFTAKESKYSVFFIVNFCTNNIRIKQHNEELKYTNLMHLLFSETLTLVLSATNL